MFLFFKYVLDENADLLNGEDDELLPLATEVGTDDNQ